MFPENFQYNLILILNLFAIMWPRFCQIVRNTAIAVYDWICQIVYRIKVYFGFQVIPKDILQEAIPCIFIFGKLYSFLCAIFN